MLIVNYFSNYTSNFFISDSLIGVEEMVKVSVRAILRPLQPAGFSVISICWNILHVDVIWSVAAPCQTKYEQHNYIVDNVDNHVWDISGLAAS